jgi:hypothetical protein
MPGIAVLGKLFFCYFFKEIEQGEKPVLPKSNRRYVSRRNRLARMPAHAISRTENNPAQIEAGERTSHRAQ